MIWNFAVGALIGGAGVAAYFFWVAAHPSNPITPPKVIATPAGPLGPPHGWHFVPNGVEGCADKYGCARPSFDPDFWKWVASGEQGCADEHGCARPRSPGKGTATAPRQAREKPEGAGQEGETPEAEPESAARPQPGSGAIPAGQELPSKPNQVEPATPPRQAGEKPEAPGDEGEKPEAESKSDAGSQPGGGSAIPAGQESPPKPEQLGSPEDATQQQPATAA
ncbi:MAG: hypothetical protein ACREDJ_08805, partial [Methylocella sp.]